MSADQELELAGLAQVAEAYGRLGRAAHEAETGCLSGVIDHEQVGADLEQALQLVDWRWEQLQRARRGYPSLKAEQMHRALYGPSL